MAKYGQRLKVYMKRTSRNPDSPRKIALSLAFGVFIGSTPLIGAQILLALLLAFVLRMNKIAAVLGTLVNNPLTAFPYWVASLYAGNLMLGRDIKSIEAPVSKSLFDPVLWSDFIIPRAEEFFLPVCVGSVVIGLFSSALIYSVALPAITKFREKREQARQPIV